MVGGPASREVPQVPRNIASKWSLTLDQQPAILGEDRVQLTGQWIRVQVVMDTYASLSTLLLRTSDNRVL
jgi:hypothetical protein